MSPDKNAQSIPPHKLSFFDELVASNPEIERKGKTMPYAALNGNMFIFLSANGDINLRLPADKKEEFTKRYNSAACIQHGVIMKEYVVVPDSLIGNIGELKPYLDSSFEYAKTLKAKSSKKK